MSKVVKRIALTGGPGAGKSTCIGDVKKYLESLGYLVYIVPEAATLLNENGITMYGENGIEPLFFQKIILNYQLTMENLYETIANMNSKNEDVIILYDRGILDGKAYIPYHEFDKLLNELDLVKEDLLDRYDLVIHLETGAKTGTYVTYNNKARVEDESEAIKADDITFDVWKDHRNIVKIHANIDFDVKKQELLKVIKNNLIDNKRKQNKYLINYTEELFEDELLYISQYYLDLNDALEHRLRKISNKNIIRYYYTIQKKEDNGISNIILDNRISELEFNNLLNSNSIKKEINKIRKYVVINGIKCNIDLYEDGKCILESTNESLTNNDIDIIEDVTNKKEYLNSNIIIDKQN